MVTNTVGNVVYALFAAIALIAGLLPSSHGGDPYGREERIATDGSRFGRDDMRARSRQSERM